VVAAATARADANQVSDVAEVSAADISPQQRELIEEGYFDEPEPKGEEMPHNADLRPVEPHERDPLDEEDRRVYLGLEDDHYTRLERRGGAR
jgi:L-lysine 2,3-aminomutase